MIDLVMFIPVSYLAKTFAASKLALERFLRNVSAHMIVQFVKIIENDIEIEKLDREMMTWLSKLIIISHKNVYYRFLRQIEILCQIFSAHFYIWIATFDIEEDSIKLYP